MLKSLVIYPSKPDFNYQDLLSIAVSTAQKAFKTKEKISVRATHFFNELSCYVVVVEFGCSAAQSCQSQRKSER